METDGIVSRGQSSLTIDFEQGLDASNQQEMQKEVTMKTLSQVKVGETARVVKLHGEGALKRRIMDMGITKGVELYIRKVAPLGDPMEIAVRGYELSLRRADAEMVEVE